MLKAVSSYIILNRGRKKSAPGLFFIFMLLSIVSMASTKPRIIITDTISPQILTVANIAAPPNAEFYEITFYQSARFYKLMRTNKNCKQALVLLKQSKKTNKPVLVVLTEKFGDIIAEVKRQ